MRDEGSVARGVVIILVAGTVLGVAHNLVGLSSRPPRGIAWQAVRTSLPTLASVAPDSSGSGATLVPDSTRGGAGREPPAPLTGTRASPAPGIAGVAPSPSPARAEPVAAGTASDLAGVPPVPAIPELDQPVEVELAMAKRLFDAGAALFLDARDAPEYEAGHIPGALHLTRNDVLAEPGRLAALPARDRPVVTYCEGGACESSLDLARTLVEAGYRRVLVFSGGMPEWSAAGHPVERGGRP
jgi:rhodanese-related sulfurtransferase